VRHHRHEFSIDLLSSSRSIGLRETPVRCAHAPIRADRGIVAARAGEMQGVGLSRLGPLPRSMTLLKKEDLDAY
jgi:hypothetical protein